MNLPPERLDDLDEFGDGRQVAAVAVVDGAQRPRGAEDQLGLPLGGVAGDGGAQREVLGLEAAALALRDQMRSGLVQLHVEVLNRPKDAKVLQRKRKNEVKE